MNSLHNILKKMLHRSTCTQNAETHFFYNFFMDRAHNRRIVESQARALGLTDLAQRDPDYYHATFVNNDV